MNSTQKLHEKIKSELKEYLYFGSSLQALGRHTEQDWISSDVRERVDVPVDMLARWVEENFISKLETVGDIIDRGIDLLNDIYTLEGNIGAYERAYDLTSVEKAGLTELYDRRNEKIKELNEFKVRYSIKDLGEEDGGSTKV